MTLNELSKLLPIGTIYGEAVSGLDTIIHKWWFENINIGTVSTDKKGEIKAIHLDSHYKGDIQNNNTLGNALSKNGIQITYTVKF